MLEPNFEKADGLGIRNDCTCQINILKLEQLFQCPVSIRYPGLYFLKKPLYIKQPVLSQFQILAA